MTYSLTPTSDPVLWARLIESITAGSTPESPSESAASARAYRALTDALERTQPGCRGDDRFTADTPVDVGDLASICSTCPLIGLCRHYASTAHPDAGFWAGQTWTTTKKREKKS